MCYSYKIPQQRLSDFFFFKYCLLDNVYNTVIAVVYYFHLPKDFFVTFHISRYNNCVFKALSEFFWTGRAWCKFTEIISLSPFCITQTFYFLEMYFTLGINHFKSPKNHFSKHINILKKTCAIISFVFPLRWITEFYFPFSVHH